MKLKELEENLTAAVVAETKKTDDALMDAKAIKAKLDLLNIEEKAFNESLEKFTTLATKLPNILNSATLSSNNIQAWVLTVSSVNTSLTTTLANLRKENDSTVATYAIIAAVFAKITQEAAQNPLVQQHVPNFAEWKAEKEKSLSTYKLHVDTQKTRLDNSTKTVTEAIQNNQKAVATILAKLKEVQAAAAQKAATPSKPHAAPAAKVSG